MVRVDLPVAGGQRRQTPFSPLDFLSGSRRCITGLDLGLAKDCGRWGCASWMAGWRDWSCPSYALGSSPTRLDGYGGSQSDLVEDGVHCGVSAAGLDRLLPRVLPG
jgi:hypothetical protein